MKNVIVEKRKPVHYNVKGNRGNQGIITREQGKPG